MHQPCEGLEKSILAEGTMPVSHGLESNNLDMSENIMEHEEERGE